MLTRPSAAACSLTRLFCKSASTDRQVFIATDAINDRDAQAGRAGVDSRHHRSEDEKAADAPEDAESPVLIDVPA